MNNTKKPEYLAYHKLKRKFLPITEVEAENSDKIEIYEFTDQNFKLISS